MARPRKKDARAIICKVLLNANENQMLTEASEITSSPKSEVFRRALKEYHRTSVSASNSSETVQAESNPDMCVPCGEGIINIRVGAIILQGGRFLMVKNPMADYFYSVGGRIKFGETAQEAVIREVMEETGVRMEIDHLGFILENYFIADIIYPAFFRTELDINDRSVKHRVKDDRFCIRPMTMADFEPLHALLSDPAVMKYLEPPFSRAQTEHFLKAQGLAASPRILAVDDKEHRFAGYVIYHDYDEESKEIGWVLKHDMWGQGLAGLLTKQLVAMALSDGKDAVIECVPEQQVTRTLAEKHGFVLVGSRDGLCVYRRKRNA